MGSPYDRNYHQRLFYREADDSQRNRARLERLLTYRGGGRLLEIGGGPGGFLRLAQRHFDVEGLDISDEVIGPLQVDFGGRVRSGDIVSAALPAQQYDVIVAFNVLEHLPDPAPTVRKLTSALTDGGLLFGSMPHNFGHIGCMATRIGNIFDRTHVSTLPPTAWMRIFQANELADLRFFGETPFGRNHCVYIDSFFWPLLSFNLMFACTRTPSSG